MLQILLLIAKEKDNCPLEGSKTTDHNFTETGKGTVGPITLYVVN